MVTNKDSLSFQFGRKEEDWQSQNSSHEIEPVIAHPSNEDTSCTAWLCLCSANHSTKKRKRKYKEL